MTNSDESYNPYNLLIHCKQVCRYFKLRKYVDFIELFVFFEIYYIFHLKSCNMGTNEYGKRTNYILR